MDEDSPAGRAGVRAGDVIQTLDDTVLAMGDSLLGEYCKILYTHESHEVLPIQVYRPSNGTDPMGELNGTPLKVVYREPATTPGQQPQ